VSEYKPELTAAILERRRQGATIPTIMDEFDLSHTGVRYHLHKCFAAGSLESKSHVVPPERLREVQRLRNLGCTLPGIAKELGITYCQTLNAVRKLIRAKKVPAKRYPGRVDMIREMREAGLSRGEIAEALGLTREMVGSYIHNLINRGLVERKPYRNTQ
jgi:predicted transcriptional regulator